MSFDATREYFESTLNDNWVTTPIAFDNVSFDSSSVSSFIRLTIQEGESSQITLGKDTEQLHRGVGIGIIQIFTPSGSGSSTSRTYADSLSSLFRSKKWAKNNAVVTTLSPYIERVGDDGNGFFQINLIVPFRYENYL